MDDSSARTAAGDLVDVDASSRAIRRTDGDAGAHWKIRFEASALGRAPRLMSTTFAAAWTAGTRVHLLSGRRRFRHGRGRALGASAWGSERPPGAACARSLAGALPFAASRGLSGSALSGDASPPSTVRIGLTDFDLVANLDLHLVHRAGDRRGHFDRRLVGFELEDRLVLSRSCRRA